MSPPPLLSGSDYAGSEALLRRAAALLGACACHAREDGTLVWADADQAARLFGLAVAPETLAALDTVTSGAATGALSHTHAVAITPAGPQHWRADPATRVLAVLASQPGIDDAGVPDPQAVMLGEALARGRVRLFRQPIVAARDGRVVRFECLARILDADGRVISPADFIPAAERSGLVGALDIAVLRLALAALHADPGLALAVNVSAGTIADSSACADYAGLLAAAGGVGERLTVEITETIAISDLDAAARFAAAARANGARLALDDFGEGYTSFRALRALPLDEVKIDGLYVEGIDQRADSRAFVRAIECLARDLGLETVAERVETEGEAIALRTLGIGGLQGFLYGRPAAA